MNVIAITSGKGGTGKSCVAAYTGVALANSGKKTLLVECGKDTRSLDVIAAAQESAVFDVSDVFAGRCEPERACVRSSYSDDLYLIPSQAGRYLPPQPEDLPALMRTLRKDYDYILMDGVDFDLVSPVIFDTVLMVTTPDTLSVRACQALATEFFDAGAQNMRLVINNVPAQVVPIHGANDFDDVINMIGVQLIAVIPHSPKLIYSSNNSKPLDEESVTIKVYDNLAARLRGQPRPLIIR